MPRPASQPHLPQGATPEHVLAFCTDADQGLSFARAGICDAKPSNYQTQLNDWLAAGKQGEMHWLANHADVRTDPSTFLEGCQSIVLVLDQYATRNDAPDDTPQGHGPIEHGKIARYARGKDYHTHIKKRLFTLADALRQAFPSSDAKAFVDTAPVLEREHASRAGLGWVGKHSLLINPQLGSYVFIGGVATTAHIPPPRAQGTITDHCGSCTRCIDACPTDAITPYSVDARKCIAYLTIEHRSPIEEDLGHKMKSADGTPWLFGCDICQEVCPHNSPRNTTADNTDVGTINPAYAPKHSSFNLLQVLGWSEDDRREAFQGSAMKRAKLDMMQRNAKIGLNHNTSNQ